MFWLVKQVRIAKRLTLDTAARKWHDKLPGYIVKEWDRRASRAGAEPL